jgi:hypothetical protein
MSEIYERRDQVVAVEPHIDHQVDRHEVTVSDHWPAVSWAAAAIGVLLLVVGGIALLRGDPSTSWTGQSVNVVGLAHTPLLGAIEIGVGAVLLMVAATRSRGAGALVGLLLVAAGVIVLATTGELRDDLAATDAHGWWTIAIGLVLLIAVAASMRERHTTVRSTDAVVVR